MANNKEFDFIKLFYDVRKLCLTEDHCIHCKGEACLVGYARSCIGRAKQRDLDTLKGGQENVPSYDINGGYDMEDAMAAIAHTMQQCKSCRGGHMGDCLVNIVRNCYEVMVFGDEREYNGSTLMYLAELEKDNPEAAAFIAEIYKSHDNPMEETL